MLPHKMKRCTVLMFAAFIVGIGLSFFIFSYCNYSYGQWIPDMNDWSKMSEVWRLNWLLSLMPWDSFYNVTVYFSLLSCNNLSSEIHHAFIFEKDEEVISKSEMGMNPISNIIDSFTYLFGNSEPGISEDEETELLCHSVLHYDHSHRVVGFYLVLCVLILGGLVLFVTTCTFFKRNQRKSKDMKVVSIQQAEPAPISLSAEMANEASASNSCQNEGYRQEVEKKIHTLISPLHIPRPNKKDDTARSIHSFSFAEVFDAISTTFLKELDRDLGVAKNPCNMSGDGANSSLPISGGSDIINSVTSPRLARRRLNQSNRSNQTFTVGSSAQNSLNEKYLKYMMHYEKLKKRLNWTSSDGIWDPLNADAAITNDKLATLLQFLHQNCPIRPQQWSIATSIVNFTLFLLEQELVSSFRESEVLKFSRFESTGSAADGTLVGTADRFDVLLVLDVCGCNDLSVLHCNFCDEIPPGKVALALKDSNITSLQKQKLLKKECIQGVFGFFLQRQLVQEMVDATLKKVVAKLNTEHRGRMDRLPFKLHMSSSKKMTLQFDTRLLHGLGLGVGEISIQCLPALSLPSQNLCLLPSIYAVSSWRCDEEPHPDVASQSRGTLNRIFRDRGQGIQSGLLWNICFKNFEVSISESLCQKFSSPSHHRECLLILKALLSTGNKNLLLNKGEVEPYVLNTVINFLLLESPPSAWTLTSLPDRVSDAVHFLRSSFENVWLPNFVVHNPHLVKQAPALEAISCLVSGRQQNILADVSNMAAMKVLDFIQSRLEETGLSKCVKPEFSSDMWEYEFFMFG